MCLEQRGQWASARMRRGSGSSVEEEEEEPLPEEEEGPSHLRRSWRSRCGGAAAGEHSAALRVEAARVAAPARRLHRRRPDMAEAGEGAADWGSRGRERNRSECVELCIVAGVVSEFLRCFSRLFVSFCFTWWGPGEVDTWIPGRRAWNRGIG
jgi:hypothetical protein